MHEAAHAAEKRLDLEGDREIRLFETQRDPGPALPAPLPPLTFHPEAYIFRKADGAGVAFAGSSNLTAPALTPGVEWNYRIVSSRWSREVVEPLGEKNGTDRGPPQPTRLRHRRLRLRFRQSARS